MFDLTLYKVDQEENKKKGKTGAKVLNEDLNTAKKS